MKKMEGRRDFIDEKAGSKGLRYVRKASPMLKKGVSRGVSSTV